MVTVEGVQGMPTQNTHFGVLIILSWRHMGKQVPGAAWVCTLKINLLHLSRHLELSRENCWKGRHQASPPEWNVVFSWNKSLWWYLRVIPSKSTCSLQLWNKPLQRNALIFEAFVVGSWPLWLNQQMMLGLVLSDVKLPNLNQCGIWDFKKFF